MIRHVSLNHQLTTLHGYCKHSTDDNVLRLDVYIHTQPLSICHAYPHVPIKPLGIAFKLSNICCHKRQIQNQLGLIVELNSAKQKEDEQVLCAVHVALSTDTYQGKLFSHIQTSYVEHD